MDQDHREYLEDRGSHQLEVEAYERDRVLRAARGWQITVDELGVTITLGHGAVPFMHRPMSLDEAVTFANSILSEVEIAMKGDTG